MPFPVLDAPADHHPKEPVMGAPGLDALEQRGAPAKTGFPKLTRVTAGEIEQMVLYLQRARDRAASIRENAPAGSYLDSVLKRTIHGIDQEVSQLNYLLAKRDQPQQSPTKMRPAV